MTVKLKNSRVDTRERSKIRIPITRITSISGRLMPVLFFFSFAGYIRRICIPVYSCVARKKKAKEGRRDVSSDERAPGVLTRSSRRKTRLMEFHRVLENCFSSFVERKRRALLSIYRIEARFFFF